MPPKKASGAKKEVKKTNVHFENRKEEVLEEIQEREERMRKWIEKNKKLVLKQMMEAVDSLDPALLNMTLGEMLSMPVTNGEDTKENDDMRAAREMTVENGRVMPTEIQETAVRPQKATRVMELRTPAGNPFKMPSLITPRVGGGSMSTRPIRPDEVAFSVAGSPIVMGEPRERREEEGFDQFHQLVNASEEALSPTSREMVKNIKALMQRKAVIGDPV